MTTTDILSAVDAKRMRSDVEKLAAFHTRNTNSETLTESAQWLESRYKEISGVSTELMKYRVEASRRIPTSIEPVQVIASRKGTSDRWIAIGGHLDSLNLEVDAKTGRAPGANDDASGVVVALEVMRILSTTAFKNGLISAGWTGEEQGLLGSRAQAVRSKASGMKLEAVFSNDTVGSSGNIAGQKDEKRIRVFSDDPWTRLPANAELATDPPQFNTKSRELARFIEWITRDRIKDFGVKLVFRKDRFGRGGDHTPFHENGFPAVRFIEVHEEFTRQHTPHDLPEFMDWSYLANVARLNALAIASLLGADLAPTAVRIVRDQGHDTKLTWGATEGACYTIYWRETTSPVWQDSQNVDSAAEGTVKLVNKDDHFFAVGAVGGLPVAAT